MSLLRHPAAPLGAALLLALSCSRPKAPELPVPALGPGPGVPAPPAPVGIQRITGVVFDAIGYPVADARVRVQGAEEFVRTGQDGSFALLAPEFAAFPLVVTAGREGFFNTGFTVAAGGRAEIQLEAVPPEDKTDYVFAPGQTCRLCHPEIFQEWNQSDMRRAGSNTWVHDLLSGQGTAGGAGGFVYERDSVHRGHAPFSDCANCHAPVPAARAPGRVGMGDPQNPSPEVLEGVTCDVCHKVAAMDLRYENYPGVHPMLTKFRRPPDAFSAPVMFGGLDDATFTQSVMRPAFSPAIADGASLCAACHEDNNDHDDDDDWQDPGSIASEETFAEWRESPYNVAGPGRRSCVDCHMTLTSRTWLASSGGVPGRKVRAHDFHGTTGDQLERAVTLRVWLRALPGRQIEATVEVHNDKTGHAVPSGVITRNVLLKVEATSGGTTLPLLSGPVMDEIAGVGNPAAGYFAGLPGKVYTKVLADAQGRAPAFYTEAVRRVRDNRLQAGARDRQVFVFGATAAGPVEVTARLLYRRAYRALVDAKGWTRDGHGRPLADLQAPHFGHVMAEARTQEPVR